MTERVGSSRRWMSNVFGRLVGLALVIVPAVAFGCDESTQPSAETGDQAGASTATIGAASEAAKTKFAEKNFDLQMKPNGSYQAGTEGTVEVVLVAKGPFKVNDKYPYKLALKDSDGVKFPKKTVRKDAVKLEKKKAVMTVPECEHRRFRPLPSEFLR